MLTYSLTHNRGALNFAPRVEQRAAADISDGGEIAERSMRVRFTGPIGEISAEC